MSIDALRWVLGGQLPCDLASLAPLRDRVLLAGAVEEAGHVPHYPQKSPSFSAPCATSPWRCARGVAVDYVSLDDPASSGTLVGELVRFAVLYRPAEIHVTEAGDWRMEQTLKACGLPITWHADRCFLCSCGEALLDAGEAL